MSYGHRLQDALDQRLGDSRQSVLIRAGWSTALTPEDRDQYLLDVLDALLEMTRELARAVDMLTDGSADTRRTASP